MTPEQLRQIIGQPESEGLEFKAAESDFKFERLCEYAVAIANEKGGRLILGVTDKKPRRIVGTRAFMDLAQTKLNLFDQTQVKANFFSVEADGCRVVVVDIPSRPPAIPLSYRGKFFMRVGESLMPMKHEQIQLIHSERESDFSAELVENADMSDLDPVSIEEFRRRWHAKKKNARILDMSDSEVLESAELTIENQPTYAALILMGTQKSLGRFLAQAELILEYRERPQDIHYAARTTFRQGFLSCHDEVWSFVQARNKVISMMQGLFRYEISIFDEVSIREAILNAICHRDYRSQESISIQISGKDFVIRNPGGLTGGVSLENILSRQYRRNRRLAESLDRCGLVERSGQGMDLIFFLSLQRGMGRPDLSGSDAAEFIMTLPGQTSQPWMQPLLTFANSRQLTLDLPHLLALDKIESQSPLNTNDLKACIDLREMGLVESLGRGRSVRFLLSRGVQERLGLSGKFTRLKGLDKETNQQLLLKHIRDSGFSGAALSDLRQVLPGLSDFMIRQLVLELREKGEVSLVGHGKSARWIHSAS